jgi:hypothetical protein
MSLTCRVGFEIDDDAHSRAIVNGLNDVASVVLQATAVANQADAKQEVRNAATSCAFIVVPQSRVDRASALRELLQSSTRV